MDHKIKHGHYVGNKPSLEYYTWRSIKARCLNKNHHSYSSYGGSGVLIYEEWINNFSLFFKDVGPRPTKKHTLDRIRSDLGYVPGNVRWATVETQNRNRKDNVWIEANGVVLCLEDWAKKLGCSHNAIRCRIKRGWAPEKAVTTPPNKKFQSKNLGLSINRKTQIVLSISDVDKDIGIFIDGIKLGVVKEFNYKQGQNNKSDLSAVIEKEMNIDINSLSAILNKLPWINLL